MLLEDTLFGTKDLVKISIDRLKAFEPSEGYYLAFSGGKDSQVVYHLAKEAGVKFDAHYNITGIDPPELVYFIRKNYPDVLRDIYKESIFKMIPKRGLPTRLSRYCCSVLKEHGGEGRICVTGVRWEESSQRKSRKPFEIFTEKKVDRKLFNDNDNDRRLFENCMQKGKRMVNPIIDWSLGDVWQYLNSRNIEHCILYDQGYSRLGCIGCPMAGNRKEEFMKNPKIYDGFVRAMERFQLKYIERCEKNNKKPFRNTAQEWMEWWLLLYTKTDKLVEGQMDIFEDDWTSE